MVYLFWRRRLWTPPTLRRPSRPSWQVCSAFLTFGGVATPVHVSSFTHQTVRNELSYESNHFLDVTAFFTFIEEMIHSSVLVKRCFYYQSSEDFMRLITARGKSAVEWAGLSWRTYLLGVANRLSSPVRWPTAEIKLFLLILWEMASTDWGDKVSKHDAFRWFRWSGCWLISELI